MITCTPQGICSWNFFLHWEGRQARLEFRWTSEQGKIAMEGVRLNVRKHGVFSGCWSLEHNGVETIVARKSSPFSRTFFLKTPSGELELRAVTIFSRRMQLFRGSELLALIRPVHAFTRRATIDVYASDLDFPTLAFAFWLVVILWRRAANNNGGSAGAVGG